MSSAGRAQDCPQWITELLSDYKSCAGAGDDDSPCNRFAARALSELYGLHDFDVPGDQETMKYLPVNTMIDVVLKPGSGWTSFGTADDQSALSTAQDYANQGKAVLALLGGVPHGHVALVMPGQAQYSGTWSAQVPMSASFRLGHPEVSYVCDKLSLAFKAADRAAVMLVGKERGLTGSVLAYKYMLPELASRRQISQSQN